MALLRHGEAAGADAMMFTGSVFGALIERLRTAIAVPVQVIMTFHFTVLSRLFFRADDAASSTVLIRKLLDWDARGVRPGWFRWPGTAQVPDPEAMSDHVTTAWQLREMLPQVLIDHVSLILLVVGLGYHFTPRAWLERPLAWTFGRWPAVLIGLLFVATMWLISVALDGPRANIYFEF